MKVSALFVLLAIGCVAVAQPIGYGDSSPSEGGEQPTMPLVDPNAQPDPQNPASFAPPSFNGAPATSANVHSFEEAASTPEPKLNEGARAFDDAHAFGGDYEASQPQEQQQQQFYSSSYAPAAALGGYEELGQVRRTEDGYEYLTEPVHSANKYTTGVRMAEAPAYVELPAVKRVPARRITESRLVYKPVYEEARSRLEYDARTGEVYVTSPVEQGRLIEGDDVHKAPEGAISGSEGVNGAGERGVLDQTAHRNEVNGSELYATGVRSQEAPAYVEVPATKRVPARRIIESRLIYQPIYREMRSRFEHPKSLEGGQWQMQVEHARIIDDGMPRLPEPREEDYIEGGKLPLAEASAGWKKRIDSPKLQFKQEGKNEFTQETKPQYKQSASYSRYSAPAAAFKSAGSAAKKSPLDCADCFKQFKKSDYNAPAAFAAPSAQMSSAFKSGDFKPSQNAAASYGGASRFFDASGAPSGWQKGAPSAAPNLGRLGQTGGYSAPSAATGGFQQAASGTPQFRRWSSASPRWSAPAAAALKAKSAAAAAKAAKMVAKAAAKTA